MLFHQIFARDVKPNHRWVFVRKLGISQESFQFVEELPGLTLRLLNFKNGKVHASLESSSSMAIPKVEYRHSSLLPEHNPAEERTLADWLLPFPWSVIISTAKPIGSHLSFSDEGFKRRVEQLRDCFEHLQNTLTQNEVACLQMDAEDSPATFLFHSVRGKIIRASFFPHFQLSEYQKDLGQTTYSVASLPDLNPLNLQGFDLACWQVKTTMEQNQVFKRTADWSQSLLDAPLEL